jgi:nicotinamidase-related amidase
MSTLDLDPKKTAVVVIDLQKGIGAMQTEPHASADVIARSSDLAKAARAAGGVVVQVRVGFAADFADALSQPNDDPMVRPPGGLPSSWLEYADGLSVEPTDLEVIKRQWGAVYGTDLELQLRRRGIDTVVICGIATNFGVESTARDLWERGFAMVFAEDAMASRSAEMHAFPIASIFPRIGRVRSTAEVLKALG